MMMFSSSMSWITGAICWLISVWVAIVISADTSASSTGSGIPITGLEGASTGTSGISGASVSAGGGPRSA